MHTNDTDRSEATDLDQRLILFKDSDGYWCELYACDEEHLAPTDLLCYRVAELDNIVAELVHAVIPADIITQPEFDRHAAAVREVLLTALDREGSTSDGSPA